MRKSIWFSMAVMAGFLGFTHAVTAAELELAGSTTVQKRILEPAAAEIETATGVKVTVRGINSGKGFEELRAGKVKASISSAPLATLLEKAGIGGDASFKEHVLAEDRIVPIVNAKNPVAKLTWQQLSDLNTGKVSNWKDVGGEDQPVVVVTSQPTAATREVFQDLVMKKAEYVAGAREVTSTRMETDMVSKFAGGIGAVSESFAKENAGKIKVIESDPIQRPLSIITKGEPDPDVKKVIDFLKSDAGKKHFK